MGEAAIRERNVAAVRTMFEAYREAWRERRMLRLARGRWSALNTDADYATHIGCTVAEAGQPSRFVP